MRFLVYLLLVSNLLFALWHMLRLPGEFEAVDVDEHASRERLVLLGEQRGMGRQEAAVVPESDQILSELISLAESSASASGCAQIGDFTNLTDLTQFAAGFANVQYHVRNDSVPLPPLHRVFLPPVEDRGDAQRLLASVRERIAEIGANIDTYLVIGGEFDNAVSLGMFNERSNALNVQRILSENGFDPQIAIENRLQQQFRLFVDWHEDSDFAKETRERVLISGLTVSVSENLCEMIAQPD
jgi:hypothetical protein